MPPPSPHHPQTVRRETPRPAYRAQRIVVPAAARATFYAATLAGLAAFAVFGVFNSLIPSFVAGALHDPSHAVAGTVAFTAFAGGAAAQIIQARSSSSRFCDAASRPCSSGLPCSSEPCGTVSLPAFIVGGLITGAGGGMVFKGALVVAASTAPKGARAEVLAGFFLGAYVGLSIPVIALGLATTRWAARDVMPIFAGLAMLAIAVSVRAVLRDLDPSSGARTAPVGT